MKIIRLNKKALSILLLVGILGLGFYWYQVRPTVIKHNCSWVKMHSDAKPGRPAMTQAELEAKGIIRTCKNEFALAHKLAPNYDMSSNIEPPLFDKSLSFEQIHAIWNAMDCRQDGDRVIAEYKNPINPVSAKDWYEPAATEQYQFCLHDNGL